MNLEKILCHSLTGTGADSRRSSSESRTIVHQKLSPSGLQQNNVFISCGGIQGLKILQEFVLPHVPPQRAEREEAAVLP